MPFAFAASAQQAADTTTLWYAFKKGQLHGQARYYFMATDNAKGLTDYYAHAAGGNIKYETAPYKGFRLAASGACVFNILSSDLTRPDPATNQMNRYEWGLFDLNDSSNKTNMYRLEELYLQYGWKNSHIRFGRQFINTPFINLQDGRIRPTAVGGIWAEVNDIKNIKIESGFLFEVSPRSTVRWYNPGKSIGLYPTGVNIYGAPSGYKGHITSKGIGLLGITYNIHQQLSLKIWDVLVENVFNTAMLQADYNYPLQGAGRLTAGVQLIRQDAVRNGGNENQLITYFPKKTKAMTFGASIGWKNDRWQTSFNYNRITAHGRYLVPREWGRDPFYTFLPRERNDGFGDVHAYVLKGGYTLLKARLKTQAAFGYYRLPDVTNFRLNKYGMPSYAQVNIEIKYEFAGWLQGLNTALLYVYKDGCGNTHNNNKYVINKVDMSLWNLVVNYRFGTKETVSHNGL
jgi:hypothetical protein